MDKLQLALLTAWAEDGGLQGIRGRKRMQKVIYFLQQAGCPIDAEYTLHHYGPYSREVANVTDVMVAEGLLSEHGGGSSGGQYDYKLGSETREMLDRFIRSGTTKAFQAFRRMAVDLLHQELWQLELGSTILYFYRSRQKDSDWDSSLQEACRFKGVEPSHPTSQRALKLARCIAAEAG